MVSGLVKMMNKPPYEDFHGPIDSPVSYVDFCVYQGRQTGKTHKLIMSIPDEPIVIIVWRHSHIKDLYIPLIKQFRPDYNINNIKFIRYDVTNSPAMRVERLPIYVDNAVLDMIQIEYVKKLNTLYGNQK
jgi:hypothetical protein